MIEHKQIAQFCKEHCQDCKDVTDIFDEIDKVEIKNSFKKTPAKKLNKIIAYVYVKIMKFLTTQFPKKLNYLIDYKIHLHHCVKSVHIRSYSGPHFSAF